MNMSRELWQILTGHILIAVLVLAIGCAERKSTPQIDATTSWEQIEKVATATTVRMEMWDGDPLINAFMRDFVCRRLREDHQIELKMLSGQGNALVSNMLVQLEAGLDVGDLDLVWINGETFYQLRKLDALYGPFTDRLPNNALVDWDSPFVAIDFQQPVNGYECPWGNVQLALIYDSQRVPDPPQTLDELADWIRLHPGRFTFDNSFTGMTFLKSLLYEFGGGGDSFNGPFDEAKYLEASRKLWDWLRELRPSLWRNGETFPENVAQLHQLLNNGEVDFSMSNNDGEVDNKVGQGILPETVRAYVPEFGSIRNSHYLGIPLNAPNKAGALIVANYLISLEAQLEKARPKVWGDGSILSTERMPAEWKSKFESIEDREHVAPRDELRQRALMEPAPEIMIRIHEDFRREIIEHVP